MARYADPFSCPSCSARLPVAVSRCPSCRLDLGHPLAAQLLQTLTTADDLLVRLQVASAEQPTATAVPVERATYPAQTPAPRQPRGLSGASVPRILLSLGALCLLVAAVIFLAVAWTWLGIGGRTAVLVGLTLVSGELGVVLARRGLRVAGEALTTVSLGLLALDVIGADNAGWLGHLSDPALLAVTSGAVLAAAVALAATTRLGAPQLVAAFALTGLGTGLLVVTERWQLVAALVVVAYAVLAAAGRTLHLTVLPVAAIAGGALWWAGLAVGGLEEATDHATWSELWLDGHVCALLAAALLALLPLAVDRSQGLVVRGLVACSTAMLTVTVALPAVDETATTLAVAGLAVLASWTVVTRLVPADWRVVPGVSMALGALPVAATVLGLAAQAAANALDTAAPFSGSLGQRLADPGPLAAPVLLAAGTTSLVAAVLTLVPRSVTRLLAGGGVVAVSLVGTLALHPVPIWTVTAALAVLGAALVADAVRRSDQLGSAEAAAGGTAYLAATAVGLPSATLTAVVAALVVLAATVVRWRGAFPGAREAGGLVLPVAAGGFVWTALTAADVATEWRALPVLAVVGLLAIALPQLELELGGALTAALAAGVAVPEAVDGPTSLAVHLTVAGALVTASALVHPGRRVLGWPGGVLLAAATWVRLADLGVQAPEGYTLPSAAALLVLGLVRLHHDPTATSTARALGPGLTLATVPSLLWVLLDPVSPRAVLLGAGCLVLVLLGARLRWSAPIVVGATAGLLLVLRELTPYAADVPQWVLIGIAGTLLTVVGITWEHRMRDVRYAAGYLRQLQ
ncbi:SCO7613 C-terminal domain-containing membrane protein [Nocardioides conyzicola]|uniref:DUF2157 domain-containing protein n=1 Tax=Nocardioides conyzicola TaxID=1651781 RepID=A0ABP8WW86_9ACTN